MVMKDLIHKLQIENKVRPTSCVNTAAFNTAFTTTSVDTQGCEGVVFLLNFNNADASPDYVFQLYDSDTSVTDAGAICAAADVIVRAHGATPGAATELTAQAKIPAATGVLTMTTSDDEDNVYSFTYIGPKRWVRLQSTVGTKTEIMSCIVIKYALDREPVKA
jgi:hypothetical protein